jgi:hypothetical protein
VPEPAVARIDRTVIPFCSRVVEGVPQLSEPVTPATGSINKITARLCLRSVPTRTIANSPVEEIVKYSPDWSFDDFEIRSRRSCDTPPDKTLGETVHR